MIPADVSPDLTVYGVRVSYAGGNVYGLAVETSITNALDSIIAAAPFNAMTVESWSIVVFGPAFEGRITAAADRWLNGVRKDRGVWRLDPTQYLRGA